MSTHVESAKTEEEAPVVPEGLTEHKPGESFVEWLRNDLEQTKVDLHIGGAHKKDS